MIHALLLAATAATAATSPSKPAAKTPAFEVQVSSFIALALREAPNDYAPFVFHGKVGPQSRAAAIANAAAIAPTFGTCGALPTEERGRPIMMMCSSDWMPTAKATKLYEAGWPAVAASLPADAIQSTSPLMGTWLVGDTKFTFFAFELPEKGPKFKALLLSSISYRHLAQSPLAAPIATVITKGLKELPEEFAGLYTADDDDGIVMYQVAKDFAPGMSDCVIGAVVVPELECFSYAYVDPIDEIFAAAKAAVAAALPAGFSAANCTSEPRCDWYGPEEQKVSLAMPSYAQPSESPKAHSVEISIRKK